MSENLDVVKKYKELFPYDSDRLNDLLKTNFIDYNDGLHNIFEYGISVLLIEYILSDEHLNEVIMFVEYLLSSNIENIDSVFQFSFVEKVSSLGRVVFDKVKKILPKESLAYFNMVEQYMAI